jgi:hypothetical protein
MHWDNRWSVIPPKASVTPQIAFGPGLIAAYQLETTVAVYPRIVIADAIHQFLTESKASAKAFPLGNGLLHDYCRRDFDGLWHLDVLHPSITRRRQKPKQIQVDDETMTAHNSEEWPLHEWYDTVRKYIEVGLATTSGERHQAKFRWLAQYYNNSVSRANFGALINHHL